MNITADDIMNKWRQKHLASSLPPAALGYEWWTQAAEARELARTAHQGQTRKGTADPYFIHLAEVAMIIGVFAEQGIITVDETRIALAAAWLHDAIEDCGVELAAIDKTFGPQVSNVIDALTKRPQSPEIMDSMQDSLVRIAQSGRVASIVKAADRISNLSWMPPAAWQSKQIRRYGQEGRHIAATLCHHLPHEAALALELVSDAYLKNFGALGSPSPRKP